LPVQWLFKGCSPLQLLCNLIRNRPQSATFYTAVRCRQQQIYLLNMKLTEKQIEEIAENLDCGLRCFYNLKTGEIKTILNFDSWAGADEEPWQEELNEIEDNWKDYFEFEGFESFESFKIMADFADRVEDNEIRKKLIYALNGPKPFRNFKWQIDNSGEVREQWFDYKKMRYIRWVKEQIDLDNYTNSNFNKGG